MAANRLTTIQLAARLLIGGIAAGSGPLSFAQPPAFVGAKAGAVRAAGPGDDFPVVRAAAPDDIGYDEYRNGGSRSTSQAGTTMIGRAWTDMKKMVVGPSTPKPAPAPAPAMNQGDPSLMPLSPAILPQYANGDPRRAQTNPNAPRPNPQMPPRNTTMPGNGFFGGPMMAGPAGVGTPPAMLAGKPAFNWYGYGSAPSAVRPPQGSPNWLTQTGATAGAFPHGNNQQTPSAGMPTTLANTMGPAIAVPPPSFNPPQLPAPVAAVPAPAPALPVLPTITPASTAPVPAQAPAAMTPVYTAPSMQPQPRFDNIEEPQWQPAANPTPIQQSSGVETKGAVVQAVAAEPAIIWTPITPVPPKLIPVPVESKPIPQAHVAPMPQPVAVAPSTAAPVTRPASQGPQMHATVSQTSFQQTQPINVMSNGGFPSAVKSMIMSDPRKLLELERQIRTACIRSATLIDVTETAPQTLLVRYVSRSESSARDAAQAISQMTSLRPYTVQFDVRLANR